MVAALSFEIRPAMKGGRKERKKERRRPRFTTLVALSVVGLKRHEGKGIHTEAGAGVERKETGDTPAGRGESRSFDAIVGRQIGCTRGKWDWFLSGSPGAPPAGGMP